jgi:hypothetical protein
MVSMSKSNKYISTLDRDLISLRALVAIADEGSFSAAAERIELSGFISKRYTIMVTNLVS